MRSDKQFKMMSKLIDKVFLISLINTLLITGNIFHKIYLNLYDVDLIESIRNCFQDKQVLPIESIQEPVDCKPQLVEDTPQMKTGHNLWVKVLFYVSAIAGICVAIYAVGHFSTNVLDVITNNMTLKMGYYLNFFGFDTTFNYIYTTEGLEYLVRIVNGSASIFIKSDGDYLEISRFIRSMGLTISDSKSYVNKEVSDELFKKALEKFKDKD
jgi:hypothetical protein